MMTCCHSQHSVSPPRQSHRALNPSSCHRLDSGDSLVVSICASISRCSPLRRLSHNRNYVAHGRRRLEARRLGARSQARAWCTVTYAHATRLGREEREIASLTDEKDSLSCRGRIEKRDEDVRFDIQCPPNSQAPSTSAMWLRVVAGVEGPADEGQVRTSRLNRPAQQSLIPAQIEPPIQLWPPHRATRRWPLLFRDSGWQGSSGAGGPRDRQTVDHEFLRGGFQCHSLQSHRLLGTCKTTLDRDSLAWRSL